MSLDYEIEQRNAIVSLTARKIMGSRAIDYIDTAPNPITVQIPLVEYFERIKRLKADVWQHDFCQRLEDASVNRHIQQTLAIIHAEAQLGKSVIQAQLLISWLLGHDPTHRTILGTYNVGKSEDHSDAIIRTMQSKTHQDIFPHKDGHIPEGRIAKEKWKTFARMDINDAQFSFRAVGLESGIVGSGADTYVIDDPYRQAKDAFSETNRKNLQSFWDNDINSRLGLYSNVFAMFHRYHVQDLAGYLLSTGLFDYWRYATIADGDYIDVETGKRYTDPLNRQIGEYISPIRRLPIYYANKRTNNRVWLSMFQGRPSSEEGDFFNVGKINILSAEETTKRRAECSIFVRSWDLAATKDGGDYTVGWLNGMSADGRETIFDCVRAQVDSAECDALMLKTGKRDGGNVVITIPQDPGAAGKTAVFHFTQILKDYQVVARSTSGSKEERARNFAGAVNSGDVSFADDSHLPEGKQWNKIAKNELRDFLVSDRDDIPDAAGDAHNEASERIIKGLVITNFHPIRNVVNYSNFVHLFPNEANIFQIPPAWKLYVGVKISADKSLPTSAVMVARASENSFLKDVIVAFAEYKEYDGDYNKLFEWLDYMLSSRCANIKRSDAVIWLHQDSAHFVHPLRNKLLVGCQVFKESNWAGLTELNWYFNRRDGSSPFNSLQSASGIYLAVADGQEVQATNSAGLKSLRQEIQTVGLDSKGEPSKAMAVLDCLRMVTHAFRTRAVEMTVEEKIDLLIPVSAKEAVKERKDPIVARLNYDFHYEEAVKKLYPTRDEDEWI